MQHFNYISTGQISKGLSMNGIHGKTDRENRFRDGTGLEGTFKGHLVQYPCAVSRDASSNTSLSRARSQYYYI